VGLSAKFSPISTYIGFADKFYTMASYLAKITGLRESPETNSIKLVEGSSIKIALKKHIRGVNSKTHSELQDLCVRIRSFRLQMGGAGFAANLGILGPPKRSNPAQYAISSQRWRNALCLFERGSSLSGEGEGLEIWPRNTSSA
jgi:hypothetical protein